MNSDTNQMRLAAHELIRQLFEQGALTAIGLLKIHCQRAEEEIAKKNQGEESQPQQTPSRPVE